MNQLSTKFEKVRELKSGVGLQRLLDEAYKILGNPILMIDTEYKLQVHTETVTDDPFWNEVIEQGVFSEKTLDLFGSEGFIEEVANNPIITLMSSDKMKYDRIGGKIFNKNNTFVSLLLIVACNKPFEEEDLSVFEAVCKKVSKEINNSEFYQKYEQNYHDMIIRKLIAENYDKKLDIAQIGIIYDSLDTDVYLAVVDVSECNVQNTNVADLRGLFKQAAPAHIYALYEHYIVIIISTSNENFDVNKELSELVRLLEQNDLYAGISSRFENLFELNKYYNEAKKALENVDNFECGQRVFP